jgi:hypothetical protein
VCGIDAETGIGESGQRRGLYELALAQIAVYAADAHGDGVAATRGTRRQEKMATATATRNWFVCGATARRGAGHNTAEI